MTVTAGSSITGVIVNPGTSIGKTITGVPANATIVVAVFDRTDETTTISGISDDVNGAWTPDYVVGPFDSGVQANTRVWLAYRNGCASGDTTVTVSLSASINVQLAANYIVSDAGALTFDQAATTYDAPTGSTAADSNTVTVTGSGAIVGALFTSNSQADPEPTADGAGESRLTSSGGSNRVFLFFEPFATDGTYGLETTIDTSVSVFAMGSFLEAGSGSIVPQAMAHYRMRAA